MAADHPWEVLDLRKERDLVVERNQFFVVFAHAIAISLHFLCPRDHQAEVSGFRQLRQFRGFRRRQNLGLHSHGLKMLRRSLTASRVHRSDKLCVREKLLLHTGVFPAHRTVYNCSSRPLRDLARCADAYRAVDDRDFGPEKLDVARRLAHKILDLRGVANVQNVDWPDLPGWRRNIHARHIVMPLDDLEQGLAHFSQANDNDSLLRVHCGLLLDTDIFGVCRFVVSENASPRDPMGMSPGRRAGLCLSRLPNCR